MISNHISYGNVILVDENTNRCFSEKKIILKPGFISRIFAFLL